MPQSHQAGSKASTAPPSTDGMSFDGSCLWPTLSTIRLHASLAAWYLIFWPIQIFPQEVDEAKLQQSSSLQCPSAALGWLDGVGEVLPFSEVVATAKGTTMASCPGINSLNFSVFFFIVIEEIEILRSSWDTTWGVFQAWGFRPQIRSKTPHPLPWVFGLPSPFLLVAKV